MLKIQPKRVPPQLFFDAIRPIQKLYWYIFRPDRPGAKTLVFDEGKVLIVRLGYAHKNWVFSGGGIEQGETPEAAAIREAFEESGVEITNPILIGKRFYTNQYKKVLQHYFVAETITSDLVIDGQEIVDAGWFPLDALPPNVSSRVHDEVAMYNNWKYGNN
jgi:8-oxo-dGTP pyrophosphatase MutT (NUDIX family)